MATQADYERLGAWAVMLNPDAHINRHGRQRTVPMEVLSLGASRTGTLSVQEALTVLGHRTYHYSSIFANVQDADIWMEVSKARKAKRAAFDWQRHFDQVLGDYSAITDNPGVALWRELIEAYPEAKVVLVVRDEDRWVPSIGGLIDGILGPAPTYVLRHTDPYWFGRIINLGRAWIEAFAGTTNPTQAKKNARDAYGKQNAQIRASVPKDRLLEYKLGSGWEPLCKFLGKDVPSVLFPHRNEAATLQNVFGAAIVKALKNSLFNIAAVVGVVAVVGGGTWRYAT